VAALGGVQAQRARERLEHIQRRAHVAALLEPRVPRRPDPGERRDLLAPQPGRAAPAAAGQADVLGQERGAARAQKVRKLSAAALVAARGPLAVVVAMTVEGCFFYQDKRLSCTRLRIVAG
jgi:hypothetical protein